MTTLNLRTPTDNPADTELVTQRPLSITVQVTNGAVYYQLNIATNITRPQWTEERYLGPGYWIFTKGVDWRDTEDCYGIRFRRNSAEQPAVISAND